MTPEGEVLTAAAARADALARGDADALRARLHPLFAWTSSDGRLCLAGHAGPRVGPSTSG